MARSPDVAVVGGGIVGLAAADALAGRGADVVVLERFAPGSGQSAGVARGFRHLHATPEQIAEAIRARALWDGWSARAGEPLVGEEGALRLGGDVGADAARLRAAGVAAEVLDGAGDRHPALRDAAGPLLWDPRGGAIRARRTIEWLCTELGDRVRRAEVLRAQAGRLATTDGALACGHVVLCAGAGTERLWPHVTMRRVVHLRVTFALPPADEGAASPLAASPLASSAAASSGAASWHAATWADRSERFGPLTYGVADGPGRFALGLAELGAQPAPEDPAADVVGPPPDLAAVRARLHAYARDAFPGLGPPLDEVVRLLTVLPGDDEDAYVIDRRPELTVVAGHNLFKLAPLLGDAPPQPPPRDHPPNLRARRALTPVQRHSRGRFRRMRARIVISAAAVCGAAALLGSGALASGHSASDQPAQGKKNAEKRVLFAVLTGRKEVDDQGRRGAGDPDGRGTFTATIDGDQLCFGLTVKNIDDPVAAHIHVARPNRNGPIVVPLAPHPSTGDPGASGGCVTADTAILAAILKNPRKYYANVHTAAFGAGAVRGQLFGKSR